MAPDATRVAQSGAGMSNSIRLSVLDLGTIPHGSTPKVGLREMIRAAQSAEVLGYERYWVAEHHATNTCSSAVPIAMSAVASATSRIRVGSGALLLLNHSPYVVAEQFGTLSALYSARIDLGLGRSVGAGPVASLVVRDSTQPVQFGDFDRRLDDLIGHFDGTFRRDGHLVPALPGVNDQPEIWLLGSSVSAAENAGSRGLRYAHAHHFDGASSGEALDAYRVSFRPSAALAKPYCAVSAVAAVGDTDREALRIARPHFVTRVYASRGRPGITPDDSAAAEFQFSSTDVSDLAEFADRQMICRREHVAQRILRLQAQFGMDELIVLPIATSTHQRIDTLRAVAQSNNDLKDSLTT
ncbi:MsnO8 family LLM class oxidoreductase [Curtobacterium herbarum]|uniref:LLM class flavin-dependent oxidoreductase n=1 Tax=Curtobacterium herbarum TaxID=150122 RepID=A0ABN1ZC62_9MICO|nr:MsnO8 family LLM class oxidoreductase [Curtobacterium herbarum]MBM7477032.1 luciferase family oxidoreductase group 1 [Curtobacterium herbarum]MCS6544959.1 MsnO8 family LLM class oxidoreductase [Curtobacterium herbarum]